jgi:hypothetical protein
LRLLACGTAFPFSHTDITGVGDVTGFTIGPTLAAEAVAVTAATAAAAALSFFVIRACGFRRIGAVGSLGLTFGPRCRNRFSACIAGGVAGFGQLRVFRARLVAVPSATAAPAAAPTAFTIGC